MHAVTSLAEGHIHSETRAIYVRGEYDLRPNIMEEIFSWGGALVVLHKYFLVSVFWAEC